MKNFKEIAEKCLKHKLQGTFIIVAGASSKIFISSSDLGKDSDPHYPYILKNFARCDASGMSAFGHYLVRLFCKNIFVV